MEKTTDDAVTISRCGPNGPTEDLVIRGTQWSAIRELHEAGVSRKAIARELDLDVKTVRKWLKKGFQARQSPPREKALGSRREFVEARLPEIGFNGKVLERELREQGWGGHYATLARFVAPFRKAFRGGPEATVRFETDPGQQAQVDWGSTEVVIGGERVRIHVFTMVLGYSRRLFARAYRSEGLGSLLDAHVRAFAHFGGRCESILYDNPRTIVLSKDGESGEIRWNAGFKDRMDFYGVRVKLCAYYRAQTKGKVESGVKYVKRNGLVGREFRDLDAVNEHLETWCLEVADQRVHGTTHEKPAERFERERERLIAVDGRPVPVRERVETRRVPKDALVAVESNRYPVPYEWMGREVSVRILESEIVLDVPKHEPVTHPRLAGKHQVARWVGPPRSIVKRTPPRPASPPLHDGARRDELGHVDVRPLSQYESLAEAGR
jgi:transposase